MQKIPTMFQRNWDAIPHHVIDAVTPGCEWVLAGEGKPTRKIDGTACLVQNGKLYKRKEIKAAPDNETRLLPEDFIPVEKDKDGHWFGWLPVGDGPEDRYFREAFYGITYEDGTYELIGPKVNKNPEKAMIHALIRHGGPGLAGEITDVVVPRTFDGLLEYFTQYPIEGIVFHHEDGRMAKIKGKDFGLKRKDL